MPGPRDDTQYPKRITLPTLDKKMGSYMGGSSKVPFMNAKSAGIEATPNASRVTQNLFGGGSTPRPPFISSGGRSVMASPVAYNPALFPPRGGGLGVGGGIGLPFGGTAGVGGAGRLGVGGSIGLPFGPTGSAGSGGAGGGGGAGGMHPEEAKWKSLADKFGVNWDVTKSVYMRSPRNPDFSPARALDLQLDDKAWGDAARAAGILTGDADYDNQVWIDHYNANGNMALDPMAGHNYAQMAYQANQQRIQDIVNGVPTPPEWL